MNDNKLIIIINGKGESGKDTICDIVDKYYFTTNISSIDIPKEILRKYAGWDGKCKDDKVRKTLSDLKKLLTEYDENVIHNNILNSIRYNSGNFIFVHIREPHEIDKFKEIASKEYDNIVTLLIRGRRYGAKEWNNDSDRNVGNYKYDYYFNNESSLEDLEKNFIVFFKNNLEPLIKNIKRSEIVWA